jgi:hypothetical protein
MCRVQGIIHRTVIEYGSKHDWLEINISSPILNSYAVSRHPTLLDFSRELWIAVKGCTAANAVLESLERVLVQ